MKVVRRATSQGSAFKDETVATISPTQQVLIHWIYPSVPLGVRWPPTANSADRTLA